MQVMANLAQDPHCIIAVPKDREREKMSESARQLIDAQ